jgi:hypothetical protein
MSAWRLTSSIAGWLADRMDCICEFVGVASFLVNYRSTFGDAEQRRLPRSGGIHHGSHVIHAHL